MDPISVLLEVVALVYRVRAGIGAVGSTGFLIARGCLCLAALDLLALTTWWLYTSESAGMEACNRGGRVLHVFFATKKSIKALIFIMQKV
jgi:hypothetical protein